MKLIKIYYPKDEAESGFLVGYKIEEDVYFVTNVIQDVTCVPQDQVLLGVVNLVNSNQFDLSLTSKNGRVMTEYVYILLIYRSGRTMIIYYKPNQRYSLSNVLDATCESEKTPIAKIVSKMALIHKKKLKTEPLQFFAWPPVLFLMNATFELILYIILLIQAFISFLLHILTINTPYQYKLDNLTFFGEQLYLRLSFFYKDNNVSKLRTRDSKVRIIIDVILGSILAVFILRNTEMILEFVRWLLNSFKGILTNHIIWLLGWPGGLKLNDYLDHVFGSISLGCINWWTSVLDQVTSVHLVRWVGISAFFGISFCISLISDFLAFATSYLFLFYLLFSRLYSVQLTTLLSLWRLFRGLKKNDLRSRIDSFEYNIAQMILGSLYFTLLLFLFPTVAVYYFTFTALRVFISLIQSGLGLLLSFFNSFPIYLIWKRITSPSDFPSGVCFEYLDCKDNVSFFNLQSRPASWRDIFFQNGQATRDIESPVVFLEVAETIMTGQILPRDILGLKSPSDTPTLSELKTIYQPKWMKLKIL